MDVIEPVEIDFKGWKMTLTAYRTPETREYNKQFNPKDLYRRVEKRMLCEWPFTGEAHSERTIKDMLFLESEIGYFVAVPQDVFKEKATIQGFRDSIAARKIEIVQKQCFGDYEPPNIKTLVMISEEALKKAQEFKI